MLVVQLSSFYKFSSSYFVKKKSPIVQWHILRAGLGAVCHKEWNLGNAWAMHQDITAHPRFIDSHLQKAAMPSLYPVHTDDETRGVNWVLAIATASEQFQHILCYSEAH